MKSLSSEEKVALVENTEKTVWKNLWTSVDQPTAFELGLHIETLDGGCALQIEQTPYWLLNRVLGLGLETPIREAALQHIVDMYRNKNLPVAISLSPAARPSECVDWLQQRGFKELNRWVKMIRDNSPPPNVETDFHISQINEDQQQHFENVVQEGFGLPPQLRSLFGYHLNMPDNHVFLAWEDEIPVAAGVLTVVGEVGHLNTATTLKDYRRRGAQGAMMSRRIQHGIDLGCRYFVTETGAPDGPDNPSYNNMLRTGFELVYERPNWVLDTIDPGS